MEVRSAKKTTKTTTRKANGISLVSAIYAELSDCLEEEEISTEELLQSAQKLIELSKKDYVTDTHSEPSRRAGYYSHDVCTAFEKYQGRVLVNEFSDDQDELFTVASQSRVRELLGGSRNDMIWGY